MVDYRPEEVMNGTFGEVWIDSDMVSEITAFKAEVTPKTETISQSRELVDGTKIVGLECKGELKLNKVRTRFGILVGENLKKAKQTEFTIISKLDDPSSRGAERVKCTGCVFTNLTLADWEHKKNGEESMPFTFRNWEYLDVVK